MVVVAGPGHAAAQAWNVDSARTATSRLEFVATEGTWMSVDVSPDGRLLAFDLLGHIYEMPIEGGDARPLTRGRSWNHLPRYSPDGTRILFTSDRSGREALWVLHRGSDSLERFSRLTERTVQGAWSADGRFVYATTMDLGSRFGASRLDRHGGRSELIRPAPFSSATQFAEHPDTAKVYFARPEGEVDRTGFVIRSYDLTTGEETVEVRRPGGAFAPALSRDGRWLAYGHRDDRRTVLVVRDLASGAERAVMAGLDRDRQESGPGGSYGAYPNMSWHPDGRRLYLSFGGRIREVNVAAGTAREVPIRAPVRRDLERTIRVPITIPAEGRARTRSHRWGLRTDAGIVFEALGDLHLLRGAERVQLTDTPELETSPAVSPAGDLYYAAWSDDSLGAIWVRPLAGGAPRKVTTVPSQYGSLTLSRDGSRLAFLRGAGDLLRGARLEDERRFDLVVVGPDREERKLTEVTWFGGTSRNSATMQPPGLTFSPDGRTLYFSELATDTLVVKRIGIDGSGERALYLLPHAARALVSPDLQWIHFREYTRSFVAPAGFAGRPVTLSAHDRQGVTYRVDSLDGAYTEWTAGGGGLQWTRGTGFYEKPLADVLAGKGGPRKTELAFDYAVDVPASTIVLRGAKAITMDSARRVLAGATIVIRGNRIAAVGPDVPIPEGARVYDLAGKVVMPGIVDAHGHYGRDASPLQVTEQRHQGLVANLAYGVTTVFEMSGNLHKDYAVSDLQIAGRTPGSRLLSVGPVIYGLRFFRPKQYRPIGSEADALEAAAFNRDHGAPALKDYAQFDRSARQQLYAAARRYGLNVVAETAADHQMNWTQLIDGVSGLEHSVGLTPLYDDVIRLWRATAAGNTPTLVVAYNGPFGDGFFHQRERLWEDPKLLRFFRSDDLIGLRRTTHYFDDDVYAIELAGELRKLHKAGISLQVSGHGQMHGLDKHWEMELMARGGFSPAEILGFATIQSAAYLGLDRQLGSIEAGKLADLVVLGADPLADIRNTRGIELVLLNGVVHSGKDGSRLYPDPRAARPLYFMR
jgi:Tol biopolymer transport system component